MLRLLNKANLIPKSIEIPEEFDLFLKKGILLATEIQGLVESPLQVIFNFSLINLGILPVPWQGKGMEFISFNGLEINLGNFLPLASALMSVLMIGMTSMRSIEFKAAKMKKFPEACFIFLTILFRLQAWTLIISTLDYISILFIVMVFVGYFLALTFGQSELFVDPLLFSFVGFTVPIFSFSSVKSDEGEGGQREESLRVAPMMHNFEDVVSPNIRFSRFSIFSTKFQISEESPVPERSSSSILNRFQIFLSICVSVFCMIIVVAMISLADTGLFELNINLRTSLRILNLLTYSMAALVILSALAGILNLFHSTSKVGSLVKICAGFLLLSAGSASLFSPWFVPSTRPSKEVMCWTVSWAIYRGNRKFVLDSLDPYACTHLIYVAAKVDPSTLEMTYGDSWADIKAGNPNPDLPSGFSRMQNLKAKNPVLKTIISLGGVWNTTSKMISTSETRRKFVQSAMDFMEKHKFDGLAWDVQGKFHQSDDSENVVLLLKDLHESMKIKDKTLIMYGDKRDYPEAQINMVEVGNYVDYIIVVSYNYYSWPADHLTGHIAPISGVKTETFPKHNMKSSLEYWHENGVSKSKIIGAVPFFGNVFQLSDADKHGLYDDAVDTKSFEDFPGSTDVGSGSIAYFDLCRLFSNGSWTKTSDDLGNPYMFSGDTWISYDNQVSLAEKARLILKEGYAGLAAWTVDMADFSCECSKTKWSLLSAMNSVFGHDLYSFSDIFKSDQCS